MAIKLEEPFSISPNPLSMYITGSLDAVLHKSRTTINARQGLSVIIGGVGLGKSSIMRYLWAEYGALEDCRTVFLPTPNFPSPFAFLKEICLAFALEPKASRNAQERLLQEFLFEQYEADKNVIIFIDEAQNLDNKQLEMLRAILNFETTTEKLAQIVLAGQIELQTKLSNKKNEYLTSRVFRHSTLNTLTLDEAAKMIDVRCEKAKIVNPFSGEAIEKIYFKSGGVPRSILKMCSLLYDIKIKYELEEIPIDEIENIASEVAV